MRGTLHTTLLALGLIAIAFGLGANYATGELGTFGIVNLLVGGLALLLATGMMIRRFEGFGASAARPILLRRIAILLLIAALAAGLVHTADRLAWQWDWTADRRFQLAPATEKMLAEIEQHSYLGPLQLTLFFHSSDFRTRPTRLLLRTFAQAGPVNVREVNMKRAIEEMEYYEVGSSNTVVVEWGKQSVALERPTEGAILEAIQHLRPQKKRVLYFAQGEGEGELRAEHSSGYSGLWAALLTEGYEVRPFTSAAFTDIPADARALLFFGPRRRLEASSLTAIERHLESGGRLILALEPGSESGLEEILERFGGIRSPSDRLVIDPMAAAIEGQPRGLAPLVNTYAKHPITAGLDTRTLTLFASARPLYLERLPRRDDQIHKLAFTSRATILSDQLSLAQRNVLPPHIAGTTPGREVLAIAGKYERDGQVARIVVFGDADFASNRYLRSLYNLDLIMNAVHWVTEREAEITLRPKLLNPYQEPLTPQDSLRLFYTLGLLIPELLLIATAIAWIRARNA